MGWDNEEWAARHIRKHGTTPQEAWEVVYEDVTIVILRARDQLRYPPFMRYWTIGRTKSGRKLFVVWDKHRATKNLITAFEPDQEKEKFYEREKKKR